MYKIHTHTTEHKNSYFNSIKILIEYLFTRIAYFFISWKKSYDITSIRYFYIKKKYILICIE